MHVMVLETTTYVMDTLNETLTPFPVIYCCVYVKRERCFRKGE